VGSERIGEGEGAWGDIIVVDGDWQLL
jgi:hypothetical protein